MSLIGSILLYFIVLGSSVMLPLYVQTIKGYSATISGFVTLPGAIVMAVLSPIAGKIYDKLGIRKLYNPVPNFTEKIIRRNIYKKGKTICKSRKRKSKEQL